VWNVPTLLGALFVLAIGMGFNNPSLSSMVSRLADPDDQGGILGLASSLASLGRVVGPAWGGYLYDAYGMTTPYLSAAALMLIAYGVSFAGLRLSRDGDGGARPST
jgi:predicted MFS family arabinose efflux permease